MRHPIARHRSQQAIRSRRGHPPRVRRPRRAPTRRGRRSPDAPTNAGARRGRSATTPPRSTASRSAQRVVCARATSRPRPLAPNTSCSNSARARVVSSTSTPCSSHDSKPNWKIVSDAHHPAAPAATVRIAGHGRSSSPLPRRPNPTVATPTSTTTNAVIEPIHAGTRPMSDSPGGVGGGAPPPSTSASANKSHAGDDHRRAPGGHEGAPAHPVGLPSGSATTRLTTRSAAPSASASSAAKAITTVGLASVVVPEDAGGTGVTDSPAP